LPSGLGERTLAKLEAPIHLDGGIPMKTAKLFMGSAIFALAFGFVVAACSNGGGGGGDDGSATCENIIDRLYDDCDDSFWDPDTGGDFSKSEAIDYCEGVNDFIMECLVACYEEDALAGC
jgi:hypothetical protein